LKAMERRGLVKFARGTGCVVNHWTGIPVKATYVDDYGDNVKHSHRGFEYKGKMFKVKYFDGCFNPFVVEVGTKLPEFV